MENKRRRINVFDIVIVIIILAVAFVGYKYFLLSFVCVVVKPQSPSAHRVVDHTLVERKVSVDVGLSHRAQYLLQWYIPDYLQET